MMTFSAGHFLKVFAPIPNSRFAVAEFTSEDQQSQCTLQHLGGIHTPESQALSRLLINHFYRKITDPDLLMELGQMPFMITIALNDNDDTYGIEFKGNGPKGRLMYALKQIQRKELGNQAVAEAKKLLANPKTPNHAAENGNKAPRQRRVHVAETSQQRN